MNTKICTTNPKILCWQERIFLREENAKDFSLVAAEVLCVHPWFHFLQFR